MRHRTIGFAEDDVAYDGVTYRGHRGCVSLTICVANHGTEEDDIVDDGLLNRQSDKITSNFSTLKTNNQF